MAKTARHVSTEVAKTVVEVADVAWTAVERCQHHRQYHETDAKEYSDAESLRSENQRLRRLLKMNLRLLQHMSTSPNPLQKCPSEAAFSRCKFESFLNELENLREKSKDDASRVFPFEVPSVYTKAVPF